jgi:hypothetical protein
MTPEEREKYNRYSTICWEVAQETSRVTKEDPVTIYRRQMLQYSERFNKKEDNNETT